MLAQRYGWTTTDEETATGYVDTYSRGDYRVVVVMDQSEDIARLVVSRGDLVTYVASTDTLPRVELYALLEGILCAPRGNAYDC